MNDKLEYLKTYFLDHVNILKFENQINNSEFHIFGASGALGLSLLELLSAIDSRPKSVTLYGRTTSNFEKWYQWGSKNGISIRSVVADSLMNVSLANINNDSCVIYLPGYAQPAKFMATPGELFDLNITLLKSVLEKRPAYLLFSSTTEIYSGLNGEISEDSFTVTTPSHPRGAYIEAKRSAEALITHIAADSCKAVAFRIALATPPSHIPNDNRILSDIVSSALDSKKVQLRGGWDSVRQYQWGPICMAKLLYAGFNGNSTLYNIAGGESVTLDKLARLVASKLNADYIEGNDSCPEDIGAPQSVCISTVRFDSEFLLELPVESLDNLLNVYLSDFRC